VQGRFGARVDALLDIGKLLVAKGRNTQLAAILGDLSAQLFSAGARIDPRRCFPRR
jgi:hypothetical protein